jgi:phosphoglycolate phosphatase
MGFIKVLTFDCDGVLFDTEKANRAFYNHILEHFGRPHITAEAFSYAQMHTADEAMAHLFPDPEELSLAQAYRKQVGYGPYFRYMEMEPDLRPLLEKYIGRFKIAVATNRTDTMHRVLAEHGIDRYFDLVVTALDVPHPKPYPDPLIRVLEHYQILPEEMIYVGDSKLDEMAAQAAGVPLVAYNNPSLAADYHIHRLRELDGILNPQAG